MKKQPKFKKGDCVVYDNGKGQRPGVCTSDANRDDRVGVQFDDGKWGYCHVSFVHDPTKYFVR